MGNKLFFTILSFFGILFFGWYTLVYSSFYKNNDIKLLSTSSKNIYINSQGLNSNIVFFNSNSDISKYNLSSPCKIQSNFSYSNENIYVFNLKFLDQKCKNPDFYLLDDTGKIISNTNFKLNIIGDFDLYNRYTDADFEYLNEINEKIFKLKNKYKIFLNILEKSENIDFIKKVRYYKELDYNNKIIENILFQRQFKYKIPVEGYDLPLKNINKLPNGFRPYRSSYTYGIHEGWDIDAPLGQEVISIDSGIIVKVIRDFNFSDLGKLKKTKYITYNDKINNLDILRGNQVWLKTMKGDIIFYAHLSKVYDDIQVGNIVPKGYPLGKVGKTGVPDKDYLDYHLHFELRKNPYLKYMIGKNTTQDYMNWNWYFKTESRENIKEKQYTIFDKEYERQLNYKK